MAEMTEAGEFQVGDKVSYVGNDGAFRTGTVSKVQRLYQVVPEGTVGILDEVLEALPKPKPLETLPPGGTATWIRQMADVDTCTCFWVDPKLWTMHYGAAEPGSQREWNPDCPDHPPASALNLDDPKHDANVVPFDDNLT